MLPFYEPRRPERRLPTKSRARTQASSRAAIRLRRRSPSCVLAPILPGRRGLRSQGGQDGPVRKEACWKPLSTPGARIPGNFAALAPFGTTAARWHIERLHSQLGTHFWHSYSLLIIQETVQPLGIHQCYRRGDFRSSRDSPEITRGTRTSCSAVVFGALRLREDATETAVGPPNTFRAPASPRTSRSPPAKAARTRRRFSRVLQEAQQRKTTR